MSQVYWVGGAPAVAQITKVTVGGTLAGETFTISIGGEVIATHTDGTTNIADTVAALVAAFNESTCPYAAGIIAATDDDPDVVLTSEVDGMPFVITINTPGGSATLEQATPTASAGPNHWDDGNNWSDGGPPDDSDSVIIDDPDARILWGMDQNALTSLVLHLNTFSLLGLRRDIFITSADGTAHSAHRPEYRYQWLSAGFAEINIGKLTGGNIPAIGRCKIEQNQADASVVVHHTGNASLDPNLPSVRFLTSGISVTDGFDILINDAPGGVGFGLDRDGDVECVLGDVKVRGANSKVDYCVYSSSGYLTIWWDAWIQEAGTTRIYSGIQSPSTLPAMVVNGGTVYLEPYMLMAGLTINDSGTVYETNVVLESDEITTVNLNRGGHLDMTGSRGTKTYTTVNQEKGSTLVRNDLLTIGTWNLPADQDYTMALT